MATINFTERAGKFPLKRTISLMLMCTIGLSSVFSVSAFSREVQIQDGNTSFTVTTLSTETNKILEQAHVTVSPADVIVSDNSDEHNPKIFIKRAFTVTVKADGKEIPVQMAQGTVSDAVVKAGVTLVSDDTVSPAADTELVPDMSIAVARAVHITITTDGKAIPLTAYNCSVQEAVSAAGVTVGAQDVLNVDASKPIIEGMNITVDRVGYRDVTTTEAIPYKTVTTNTDSLVKGSTKITVSGANGVRTIVTHQKIVNGQVAESTVTSSTVTKDPVDEQKLVGTAPKVSGMAVISKSGTLTDHQGNTVSYRGVISGRCTAYTASFGKHTSTGQVAQYGLVAVNPNIIPYGTKLYICSPDGSYVYGYAIAADTGGGVMSGSTVADLFYDTVSDCYSFGSRTMSVYIL